MKDHEELDLLKVMDWIDALSRHLTSSLTDIQASVLAVRTMLHMDGNFRKHGVPHCLEGLKDKVLDCTGPTPVIREVNGKLALTPDGHIVGDPGKAEEIPAFRGTVPGVHWLSHVLAENVGWVTWVPKTPEDRAAYVKTLPESMQSTAYPLKAVKHPIPEGENIVLKDSKEHLIACNNLDIREMLIGMAQRFIHYQREYHRLYQETWRAATDPPLFGTGVSGVRRVMVASKELYKLDSFHLGYFEKGVWYAIIGGVPEEHPVEQWRYIPMAPN